MSDTHRAYPLQWPADRPRTPPRQRRNGRFKADKKPLSVHAATERLTTEIRRLGGTLPVVSTNIEPRLDGLPRSFRRPVNDDPGVCLYFQLQGKPRAMPCDTYDTVEDNLAAIAAHIEATRAITRHGVATVEQMFEGFLALRGPGERPWQETLGIPPGLPVTREIIRLRVTALARQHHPDRPGGSHERMAEINAAADRALAEVG
jgi:hypothetical protein